MGGSTHTRVPLKRLTFQPNKGAGGIYFRRVSFPEPWRL
jgi:hypothetical protein